LKVFPTHIQAEAKDCGPTCIKIIGKYYGKHLDMERLRVLCETTREGSSLLNLSEASEKIGFRTMAVKIDYQKIFEAPLPCIVFWDKYHYVVVYKIKNDTVYISDPAHGLLSYPKEEFIKHWVGPNANETTEEGFLLIIEPTPKFYEDDIDETPKVNFNLTYLSRYLFKYKSFIVQLLIGLLAGSIIQLMIPFLTQSIVDVGIQNQDVNFIYLILFAQIALYIGQTSIEVIRGWILLHMSTRINISIISDFFIKLMNLPIAYFDVKMTGDIMQRINDHKRIEQLLTTSSLNVIFSMVNFVLFGLVLAFYNLNIFYIFMIGSILYFLWIKMFLKQRAILDYKRFSVLSKEQSKVIELINGMQDIKLHNAEKEKRWAWEHTQANLFKVSIKNLALEQKQSVGSSFINELKNICITVLSATLVIDGEITIGVMLAISYIVGQLNAPVEQMINFVREWQDAKIALERLAEIHNKDDEETNPEDKIHDIPESGNLSIKNLSFRYQGTTINVLKDLNLNIPPNKTTAIVGVSGSGKTTLMKLLLKFYEPNSGEIRLNNFDLKNISHKSWRSNYGVVMQEGHIFNDTIANNICIGESTIDKNRLAHAIDVANIREYIEALPLTYNTKIGLEGIGLSTGQKQRLLIARAVYKDPKYLFFDEATSALDANNEKVIMEKLDNFFNDKTVLIIAHRLSTVKNAHQIVVLNQGEIVEIGNHQTLVAKKGYYFNLVKNQLELGK